MDEIVFHAKLNKGDIHPHHTIAFRKQSNGTILCTYAKPHNDMDRYSKEFGRDLALARLSDLQIKLAGKKIRVKEDNLTTTRKIKRFAPNTVVTNMGYYLDKAKKALKIDGNPTIVLRGQFADWEKYEAEELKAVPTHAVALMIDPTVISKR